MTSKSKESLQSALTALNKWLLSCTRSGKISRNTIAIGIVVLDHLRQKCPISKINVLSKGGEIKGARSSLCGILQKYGIPTNFLKEVTTRQAHQDGQKLLDALHWGEEFKNFSTDEISVIITELIKNLTSQAAAWFSRQKLRLEFDRRHSPAAWTHIIIDAAKNRSTGIVEQHLVGAKLSKRFQGVEIPNRPAHAADVQTAREGDFVVQGTIYHVTAAPSRNVVQKCASNIRIGKHAVLLVPKDHEYKATALVQDEGVDAELTIISIEDFVALNIIELATQENKDFFTILQEIVRIYNTRLSEVETDLSLQIEVR